MEHPCEAKEREEAEARAAWLARARQGDPTRAAMARRQAAKPQRAPVRRGAEGESDEGEGEGEEEEDGRTATRDRPCPRCGRTYPHEHVPPGKLAREEEEEEGDDDERGKERR